MWSSLRLVPIIVIQLILGTYTYMYTYMYIDYFPSHTCRQFIVRCKDDEMWGLESENSPRIGHMYMCTTYSTLNRHCKSDKKSKLHSVRPCTCICVRIIQVLSEKQLHAELLLKSSCMRERAASSIPHNGKFWRCFYFGDLAILESTAKLKFSLVYMAPNTICV